MDPNDVSSKLIELEDRSRRNNLRIRHIAETLNKTWEDCEIKMRELIKSKLKMNEHIETDRCHRLLRKKNQNRPSTIISRETKILKNARLLRNTVFSSMKIFAKTRWN